MLGNSASHLYSKVLPVDFVDMLVLSGEKIYGILITYSVYKSVCRNWRIDQGPIVMTPRKTTAEVPIAGDEYEGTFSDPA